MKQDNQSICLVHLSLESGRCAAAIEKRLKGCISDEATQRLAQGFMVPALGALAQAASRFTTIATLPGQGWILGHDSIDERLDLICALGGCPRMTTFEVVTPDGYKKFPVLN